MEVAVAYPGTVLAFRLPRGTEETHKNIESG